EDVAATCAGSSPQYIVGPHHGAPIDRKHALADSWLRSIGAEANIISVGSTNRYNHPQKSYIRKSVAAGSRIMCTQLTKLCDKYLTSDVIRSHARYTLPPPNSGFTCRDPVRATILPSDDLIGDELDSEHQIAIKK